MAKSSKTPVMVLTELTVKRGFPPPEFNLIYSKSNTHDNEFTYKVEIEGVAAVGCGKSKKEAKHITAYRALELLNEKGIFHPDYSTLVDPIQRAQEIPSPKKPSVNCINSLADMCIENKLPEPEFIQISDVGPPHAREFTYECRLGSFTTRASAGTKKQARQLAAKDMFERTKNIIPEIALEFDKSIRELDETDARAVCKFEELSNFNVKPNLNIRIVDYNSTFESFVKEKGLENSFILKYLEKQNFDNLELLLEEVGLKCKVEVVQDFPPYIVCVNVNVDTPFTSLAADMDLGKCIFKAVVYMFEMIKIALNYKS